MNQTQITKELYRVSKGIVDWWVSVRKDERFPSGPYWEPKHVTEAKQILKQYERRGRYR